MELIDKMAQGICIADGYSPAELGEYYPRLARAAFNALIEFAHGIDPHGFFRSDEELSHLSPKQIDAICEKIKHLELMDIARGAGMARFEAAEFLRECSSEWGRDFRRTISEMADAIELGQFPKAIEEPDGEEATPPPPHG